MNIMINWRKRVLCLVCGNSSDDVETMHYFPSNLAKSKIWQENMGMIFSGNTYRNQKICCRHFDKKWYIGKRLGKCAVPTLYPCRITTHQELPPVSGGVEDRLDNEDAIPKNSPSSNTKELSPPLASPVTLSSTVPTEEITVAEPQKEVPVLNEKNTTFIHEVQSSNVGEETKSTIGRCCVPGCDDKHSKRHRFPKNEPTVFQQWIEQVNVKGLKEKAVDVIYKNYLVCHRHFDKHCLVVGTRRGLRRNAIPTLYLNENSNIDVPNERVDENGQKSVDCGQIDISTVLENQRENYASNKQERKLVETVSGDRKQGSDPHFMKSLDLTPCKITNEQRASLVEIRQMEDDEEIAVGGVLGWQDFSRICRACLSMGPLANIAEIQYPGKDFFQIINELTSLGITPEDGLPQTLCEKCIRDIVQLHSFKTKLMQSDSILKNIYSDYVKNILHSDLTSVETILEEPVGEDSAPQGLSEFMLVLENGNRIRGLRESGKFQKNTVPEILTLTDYYKCPCDSFFINYADYLKHVKETQHRQRKMKIKPTKEYKCSCEKIFVSYTEYVNHRKETQHKLRREKIFPPKEYKCSCETVFTSYVEYINHRKETQHKSALRLHVCPICGKSVNAKQLTTHINIHAMKYDCKTCNRKFSTKCNLDRHIKIHTGEKSHICEFCGKGFIQKLSLVEHRRVHHNVGDPVMCEKCGYTFNGYPNYRTHLKRCERMDDPRYRRYAPRIHQCPICNRKMAYEDSLQAHILSHDYKQLTCKFCGKEVCSRSAMQSHLLIHQVERPYACEMCGKTFKTSTSLRIHSLIHKNESPYTCKYCAKRCNQPAHLKLHLRQHTGERPYTCQYCYKTFVALASYKAHVRIHTGERPYKCDQCTKAFYDSSSLWKHRRKAHVEPQNDST